MDPDEALARFRQAYAAMRKCIEEHDSTWTDHAQDAAEAASVLDCWLTSGGFAPAAWHR